MTKMWSDLSAIIFLILSVMSTFVFEVYVVLPHIHNSVDFSVQYFHIFNGVFILYNILSNLFYLMTSDTSTRRLMLPSILLANWRFCAICEANAPPRSHHCSICDVCVLKRDHHCVFSGCCIGYKNFRYYYGFLLYIAVGGLYATVLNQYFIWDTLGGFSLNTFLHHLIPFPFWMFGVISFKVMVFVFICIVDICGFLFGICLLYYHGKLLINNQTTYEKNQRIRTYDLGYWNANISESLGSNWFAAILLSPVIKSSLPRNGIDFPTSSDRFHSNKSK